MRILILGATGFIGNALFNALVSDHEVYAGSRSPIIGYNKWRKVDFDNLTAIDALLKDIDMVVNAVGIPSGNFAQIQTEAPLKIFKACKEQGIKIINISAIGAENEKPLTVFLHSKKITDDFVITQTNGKVIYPGIVLGENAQSSELFKELSNLSISPLLGDKKIPFVHITQLIEIIKETINRYESTPTQKFVVAEPETLKDIYIALQGKPIKTVKIPISAIASLFKILPKFRLGVFDKNMFALFKGINATDYKPIFNKKASDYLNNNKIRPTNHLLRLFVLLAISFIWIWSGVISLFSWQESLKLMRAIGITNQLAPVSIVAGSLVDIILGWGVFIDRYRNSILKLQIVFIVIYSLILTFFAPEFWLHPFGPIAKNIPLIMLIYLYYKWNKRYWL